MMTKDEQVRDAFVLDIGRMIIDACNPLTLKIGGFIRDPLFDYRFQLVCIVVGKINTDKLKTKKK